MHSIVGLIIIILVIALLGGLIPFGAGPAAPGPVPFYRGYGYGWGVGGVLGTVLVIVLILALLGHL